MRPLISVIIPCFNAEKYIQRCLNSLLNSTFKRNEIIIIDDHSQDKTVTILKQYQQKNPRIKTLFLKKNVGPAKARNLASRLAQGKYLLFLDIDTEIDKDCLKQVATAFLKNNRLGALQVKILLNSTNRLDTAGHFLSPFGFPYEIGVNEKEKKYFQRRLIFGARSAGMAVRKKVFQEIGGFDEDYFIYGEETDLSWRIWLAGYQILFLPSAKIKHFPKSSLNKQTAFRVLYEGAKNNTSNIIKNASLGILIWMLPLHIFVWFIISLKFILQGKFSSAGWIYKGLWWNLKNINQTIKKRKKVIRAKRTNIDKIIFGKITARKLFDKGFSWFKNV